MVKYGGSFVVGALMLYESITVVEFLLHKDEEGLLREIEHNEKLLINSESSRKRKVLEIKMRFQNIPTEFWEYFLTEADEQEQKIILYFACLETYGLLKDFHLETVFPKWQRFSVEYDRTIFEHFLYQKSTFHLEIEDWTEKTTYKMAQVASLMLKEIGIVKEDTLKQVTCSERLILLFLKYKKIWFLEEVLFMPSNSFEHLNTADGVI